MLKQYQQGMMQLYIIIAIVVVGGSAVAWYNHTIKQNARYEAAIEQAEAANASLVKQQEELHRDLESETARSAIADARALAAEQRVKDLEGIFAKHDLDYLLQKKPGLIIKRANAATDRVWDDFSEILSNQPESSGVQQPSGS